MAINADGIGPLALGADYATAVAAAQRAAPDSAFAGPGCGGLDEVRFSGVLGTLPVSAMGMAEDERLVEIELGLDAPLQAEDQAACLALRDRFAETFVARFGSATEHWEIRKPVSREFMARTGPVVLVARWFSTGRSCYVSAVYGADPERFERQAGLGPLP
ncbi:hypothetical protein [Wenzhouxiangella sp. XN24]|uniref:hypothetical protein n=1 Tax=Wenzhouxiangella sp. XN24 TaxID=2713569 RepID=UPI0013ECB002|nr:hypothetical protein [Wenzhouxiangella sp. XN24]NGX16503.1 hypothetical protein [Wenzhouxiangella sp. XN24]